MVSEVSATLVASTIRRVALKVLLPGLGLTGQAVQRFEREAQAAASIEHRNIIDVMDVGVSDKNEPYIVMEYLEGQTLAERLLKGPLPLEEALAHVSESANWINRYTSPFIDQFTLNEFKVVVRSSNQALGAIEERRRYEVVRCSCTTGSMMLRLGNKCCLGVL